MKIIYSDQHLKHAPSHQLFGNGLQPAVEVPARAENILNALKERDLGEIIAPRAFDLDVLTSVHDAGFLRFLKGAYNAWVAEGRENEIGLIPDTFAMRSLNGKPDGLAQQAGYYCFETQTPIVTGTWDAALGAAQCALTGGDLLLEGEPCAYALCRPPGHHVARDLYGGYSYLNNAALAAARLQPGGRVAILDIDYHHGNGTQAIFYNSAEVLFVSVHADPAFEYPHFSGYASEMGEHEGESFTRNFPLAFGTDDRTYLKTLDRALNAISTFDPVYLIVSLGVDTYGGDPLSKFDVSRGAFEKIGRAICSLKCPTLFVQEGGYCVAEIGACVGDVLSGFAAE